MVSYTWSPHWPVNLLEKNFWNLKNWTFGEVNLETGLEFRIITITHFHNNLCHFFRCTMASFYGCKRMGGADGTIINPIMSARLRTAKAFTFKYGKVEVSAKVSLYLRLAWCLVINIISDTNWWLVVASHLDASSQKCLWSMASFWRNWHYGIKRKQWFDVRWTKYWKQIGKFLSSNSIKLRSNYLGNMILCRWDQLYTMVEATLWMVGPMPMWRDQSQMATMQISINFKWIGLQISLNSV